jgi:hypothetical protein
LKRPKGVALLFALFVLLAGIALFGAGVVLVNALKVVIGMAIIIPDAYWMLGGELH